MRKFGIALFAIAFGLLIFSCGEKSLEERFKASELYHYFGGLENLNELGLKEMDKIDYGKFDYQSSSIKFFNTETWQIVKSLKLKPYKENVFYVENYEKFFVVLNPTERTLKFISDKDNDKSYVNGSMMTFKTLEECKAYEEEQRISREKEKECNGCQGPM
jgi:hypothetical protein